MEESVNKEVTVKEGENPEDKKGAKTRSVRKKKKKGLEEEEDIYDRIKKNGKKR